MKIGIVGTGNVAFGVARFWTKKDVSRFSAIRGTWRSAHPLERCAASKIGTPAEAVAFGEVVVLAVPWTAVPGALRQGGACVAKS
jgi:predicted dinucleotide-binding enzyme